jgi:hypothetical protein
MGFTGRATLSFPGEPAGPYQQHESALLRALEALETSRAVWRAEAVSYVGSRVATGGRLTDGQPDILSRLRKGDESENVRRPIALVVSATGAVGRGSPRGR